MSEPVTTAKLLEDLQAVVRDAQALLDATATQSGERIENVRARAEQSLSQAKSRISEVEDEALQSVREVATATQDYVKNNPWQSVGIAAGVGLLLGLLLRRRD